jgi:hypothetical protein
MSGTRIREGVSFITSNIGLNNYTQPTINKVGKVYAVILNETSVPENVWEANGKWAGLGTILYYEYKENSEIELENLDDIKLSQLPTALPLYPHQKYFPLPGEIVYLVDLPAAPSIISSKLQETYYVSVINTWNSTQFNGLFINDDKGSLYESFNENADFRGLQIFEGDYVLEGRFGNSIRFGSTNKSGENSLSPWSTNPDDLNSSPITIISNGHNNKILNADLYIEDINLDDSSLYLTSNQNIVLDTQDIKFSNIIPTTGIKDYVESQAILNANRTIIVSKKDDVIILGKRSIQNYTQGPMYFQSNKIGITMQDDNIFLGPYKNDQPTQPLVLGNDLRELVADLYQSLSNFCSILVEAKSTPEGLTITEIAMAAEAFQTYLSKASDSISNPNYLLSQKIYTI